MNKFNPKFYRGSKIITVKVNGLAGVSKLYEWNTERHLYEVPTDKKVYRARKSIIVKGKKARPSEYFYSLDEAKHWLQNMDSNSLNQKNIDTSGPTFQEVLRSWKLACYGQLADGTKVRYDRMIKSTFHFFDDIKMVNFNKSLTTKWIESLKTSLFTSRRLRFKHELKLLHSVLKYYADSTDNFIMPITTFHKKSIEVKPKKTKNQNLTQADFNNFIKELIRLKDGKMLSRMATVQYYQALRVSEVAALSKQDIFLNVENPHESYMVVSRSLKYLRLKGVKPVLQDSFKNSKSTGVKELPIFPETFLPLKLSLDSNTSDFLFLNSNNEFFDYRTIQQRYDLAFKKAGLVFLGTHVLRHGGTRNLYNQYPDLAVAGQLLGNNDIATISVYAKRDKRALFNISNELWANSKTNESGR